LIEQLREVQYRTILNLFSFLYILYKSVRFSVLAQKIRLWGRYPYSGYVQIKNGSTWRYFVNKTWGKNNQKMLCQHLGFKSTKSDVIFGRCPKGITSASGDLICNITNANRTSCNFHLETFIATGLERVPYVRCKCRCYKNSYHVLE